MDAYDLINWTRKYDFVTQQVQKLATRFAYNHILVPTHTSNPLVFRSQLRLDINRLIFQNRLTDKNQSVKVYTIGSVYKNENEFHQLDLEYMNCKDIFALVELLDFCDSLFKCLRVKNVKIHINDLSLAHEEDNLDEFIELLNSFHIVNVVKDLTLEPKMECYQGIIFQLNTTSNSVLGYGGQYDSCNSNLVIDIENLIAILDMYGFRYDQTFDERFDRSGKITIIPKSNDLGELSYILTYLKRNDTKVPKYTVDCDLSDRSTIEKIEDAKQRYSGYYLVDSNENVSYYPFYTNTPFTRRTFQEILDGYNNTNS